MNEGPNSAKCPKYKIPLSSPQPSQLQQSTMDVGGQPDVLSSSEGGSPRTPEQEASVLSSTTASVGENVRTESAVNFRFVANCSMDQELIVAGRFALSLDPLLNIRLKFYNFYRRGDTRFDFMYPLSVHNFILDAPPPQLVAPSTGNQSAEGYPKPASITVDLVDLVGRSSNLVTGKVELGPGGRLYNEARE
ncbi:hypothetical protein HK102_005466 [Quaeritorhiza haematococci]|nr:hypothetical protein HK102_005466 [Quaeritorhiza haematococci]